MGSKFYGEIIATGSELMLGQTVDTNSAWLSQILNTAGVPVVRHTSLGDDLPRLKEAFKRAWADNQVTLVTGGLGPTEDDLTRRAAAEAFELELEFQEDLAAQLKDMFQRRGYPLTENNLRQAWLPGGTAMVPNPLGTAPGFALADAGRLMVFLPGVPPEMKRMVKAWVLPRLREQFPDICRRFKTVVLKTGGLGESMVDDRVADLMAPGRSPTVGLLASPDQVRVLVTAEGRDDREIEEALAPTLAELDKRLAGHIFARQDNISLPQAVAALLQEQGLTLIILDAITQGRLSGALAPSLGPETWSGAQDLPWQESLSGTLEILRLYNPDSAALKDSEAVPARRCQQEVRLIVTARPDPGAPEPRPGESALMVESAVQREGYQNGQPLVRHYALGGATNRALARAANLAIFHLWQVLSGHH
ncbi:MAG: competence/damage-inducible protein A [Candidatus Adiutrix sp.]|jgi:nicotinamide-nucleotide amidase|nr:competence/damage-inducible protein A [Candidatus Adiutrix sp.]